ncbi:MAG: helix-turn-helix domain-containing protein, partial [Micromonosporaceae bacterium]|nr:helix-turn-helix domain-containing protein [Micromonosporaceae bacterium]
MADPPCVRLHLGELDEVRVSVARTPWPSVLTALTSVVAGPARDVVEPLRGRVARELTGSSVAAVAPLIWPGCSVGPDCLMPVESLDGNGIQGGVELIRDLPGDHLLADLERQFGPAPPARWRSVMLRPRAWLHAYAGAMEETWLGVTAAWSLLRPLIERETDRIGAAVVSGALDLVLTSIHPRARLVDNVLHLPDPEPADYHLRGRRLVLAPMISGRADGYIGNLDLPDVVWIGYGLPGHRAALAGLTDGIAAGADPLSVVLGTLRAELLRSLDHPLTMGELADKLGCTPSQLTYHCDRLATAGLIYRQRRGR